LNLLRPAKGGSLLQVRVSPRSSRDEVAGVCLAADGSPSLAIKVRAVPDRGQANDAVIEILARTAGVARSTLSIVSGATKRLKTIHVAGNPAAVEALIASLKKGD
jgi:hypothetical protein